MAIKWTPDQIKFLEENKEAINQTDSVLEWFDFNHMDSSFLEGIRSLSEPDHISLYWAMALKDPDKVKLRVEYSNSFNCNNRTPSSTEIYTLVFNLVATSTSGQIAPHHIGDYYLYNMPELMQFRDSNGARRFLENYIEKGLDPLGILEQSWKNVDELLLDFLKKDGDVLVFS